MDSAGLIPGVDYCQGCLGTDECVCESYDHSEPAGDDRGDWAGWEPERYLASAR